MRAADQVVSQGGACMLQLHRLHLGPSKTSTKTHSSHFLMMLERSWWSWTSTQTGALAWQSICSWLRLCSKALLLDSMSAANLLRTLAGIGRQFFCCIVWYLSGFKIVKQQGCQTTRKQHSPLRQTMTCNKCLRICNVYDPPDTVVCAAGVALARSCCRCWSR